MKDSKSSVVIMVEGGLCHSIDEDLDPMVGSSEGGGEVR
jgi:hypothetical protein